MKRNKLLEEIEKEILSQSPISQARAINALDSKYVPAISNFLFENKQFLFLNHLSISALVALVRTYFVLHRDSFFETPKQEIDETKSVSRHTTEHHRRFTLIVNLPKFPKVWNRVSDDKPCAAFELVPLPLMRQALIRHISKIIPSKDYRRLAQIIENGTRARKMIDNSLADEESVPLYQIDVEKYNATIKDLGSVIDNEWIETLLKRLPTYHKLKLLYGKSIRDQDFERIKTYCLAQGGHISDDRQNPIPLVYAFLDFDRRMTSFEYKYDKDLEEVIDNAIDSFIEEFNLFAVKIGACKRLVDILDFFNMITYKGRGDLVQKMPMGLIVDLLKQKRCLWMKERLSENQKIALSSKGSIDAADAHKALVETNTDTDLLSKTVTKVQGLTLRDKMQVVAMGSRY